MVATIKNSGAIGEYDGSSGSSVTFSVPDCVVGDIIILFGGIDWTWPETPVLAAPTGTGITWTARTPLTMAKDLAFNAVWTGVVGTAGSRSISWAGGARDSAATVIWYHLNADWTFVAAANTQSATAGTTGTAPAIANAAVNDKLFCSWQREYRGTTQWTMPATMDTDTLSIRHVAPGGNVGAQSAAWDTITTAGSTGTRAATATGSYPWSAVSILMRPAVTATAPVVNAGSDISLNQYAPLNITATENDGGAAITSRSWSVVSGPAEVGTTIGTSASLSKTFYQPGTYVLRYSATNSAGTGTDDVTITIAQVINDIFATFLLLTGSVVGQRNLIGNPNPAVIKLLAALAGITKTVSTTRTAPLTLGASVFGQKINAVHAPLKLSAVLSSTGKPGSGSVTASMRLTATTANNSRTGSGTPSALLTLVTSTEITGHRDVSSQATMLAILATRTGTKDVPFAPNPDIKLSALVADIGIHKFTPVIALLPLSATTSANTRDNPENQVLAQLFLSTSPETFSVRFNRNVSAFLLLDATFFGRRIVTEIAKAITARSDTLTKYQLVCVARVPQTQGPPALVEMDPMEWTDLTQVDELNTAQQLSATCKISKLTLPVLQRIQKPHELATELYLYRNGKKVFAGPLLGYTVNGESVNIVAQGLLAYTRMMAVDDDLIFTDVDQHAIVARLINQWQELDYGNFGIDTADLPASGVLRTITYLRKELHNVGQRIEDLSKMANGFDFHIDPANRKLQVWSPMRGFDRSSGEDAIVFDSRNVSSNDIACSIGPGDLASEAYGTSTSTTEDPLFVVKSNLELRSRYGRVAITGTFDEVAGQDILESYVQALLDARDQALLIPGPNTRVTPDADVNMYDVGDIVNYTLHSQLNVEGAFRIRKRTIKVSETGQESVSLEFV